MLESEANQIRASILDMAHCIRSFTEEVSDYSRKLVGIVQQIEGGEQMVEDGIGMAHTEHVKLSPLVMQDRTRRSLFEIVLILLSDANTGYSSLVVRLFFAHLKGSVIET